MDNTSVISSHLNQRCVLCGDPDICAASTVLVPHQDIPSLIGEGLSRDWKVRRFSAMGRVAALIDDRFHCVSELLHSLRKHDCGVALDTQATSDIVNHSWGIDRRPTSLHHHIAELWAQLTWAQFPGPGPMTAGPEMVTIAGIWAETW